MNHGSQTIQQQGRIFEIGEETGSGEAQSGEGERGKKDRSGICENCGETFLKKYSKEKRRFCQNSCQKEFAVNRWIKCSKCMATIGIGSKGAGKLLGLSGSSVSRGWKNNGISADRPPSGSMIHEGRGIATKIRQAEQRKWKRYESAWMEEIKSHKAFPDWGYEWVKEQSRRASKGKYNLMSDQEKRHHNQRCQANRRKKWESDPSSRLRDRKKTKDWEARNPEKKRHYMRKCIAKRKIIDPGFRVQINLRNRLKELIASSKKGGTNSIRTLIGCSTIQLAKHLQLGFTKRMSWANYGTYWHVDHILPCASFDHTDERQVAQCWHWTNLRALEAKKNMDKSDTITEPQMQLLLCASH